VANTHVALIRSINVGYVKRVAMADLRAGFRSSRALLGGTDMTQSVVEGEGEHALSVVGHDSPVT